MKRINLQLFAEEAETAATATGSGTVENTKTEEKATAGQSGETEKAKETASEQPKYTDKDLDEILNKKFAKWKEQEEKKVNEAKKLASMNATEKVEYERDQAIKERDEIAKERDELKAQATLAEMRETAKKMLSEKNINNVSDDLLKLIVTTDAEKTKQAVDSFAALFTKNVENAVNERLKGETPTVGVGHSTVHVSEVERRIKKYQ